MSNYALQISRIANNLLALNPVPPWMLPFYSPGLMYK